MNPAATSHCPVCQSPRPFPFLDLPGIPVFCNVHWPSREAALAAPQGDIQLGFCPDCGHVYNRLFQPELVDYDEAYDNSLHFSGRFQDYANDLARHLIKRHDLHGKQLLEIACGKGDFLRLLCRLGPNHGTGFDPSYEATGEASEAATNATTDDVDITFVTDYYGPKYANVAADFICCRHALEHFQFPARFLTEVRHSIGDRPETLFFCEVPNSLFMFADLSIWDIIYEHPSYFCAGSLATVFRRAGFQVQQVRDTFGSQFLTLEAVPAPAALAVAEPVWEVEIRARLQELVAVFAATFQAKLRSWNETLTDWLRDGRSVVVWGGGSKGVMFLNLVKAAAAIDYVVDINPGKQGRFVAGGGQQFVAPEFLVEYKPDVVVVMNPIYRDEIARSLAELSLTPELASV
ncbi:MAG: methyltransferase domain-containing protein [bacterium]